MMAKYTSGTMPPPRRSRLLDLGDDWWPARETLDVIVPEATDGVDTGLLDQFGAPIRRHPICHPVGFRR